MATIVTVYSSQWKRFRPTDMAYIRWLKISEALARLGHRVDMATNEPRLFVGGRGVAMAENLRRIPLRWVRWAAYDVVKTLFHIGFETLERYGGSDHPFIIAKLGSVVGPSDQPEVYFFGEERSRKYEIQRRIAGASRYVTILTRESADLWKSSFPAPPGVLLIPGAVDAEIPAPRRDPYPESQPRRCLFAGNYYNRRYQPQAHAALISKMNALGKLLAGRGIRLFVLGPGDAGGLDRNYVTPVGQVSYVDSWDYVHFAGVGIVLALGTEPNHNESTKIYHYLRAGLPVVCEAGFPNQSLITEAGLGYVAPNGNPQRMADLIGRAMDEVWDRAAAVSFVLRRHTWDHRAQVYDSLFKSSGLT